jgi:OmpA-OmpF porin, OOP family
MMPKSINARTVVSVVIGLSAASAMAQALSTDAYLLDQRSIVARSGYNLCWRTAEWTPAKAIAECDPDLVKKAEPAPAPAPVVVAPAPAAPAPKPVVVPPPPPKCDFSSTLAADATFAFGKSALTAGAKKQLDAVAAKAGGCAKVSSVRVTGHTDRIGTDKGNMKLSQDRANAVKGYLQGKGLTGVEAVGVGKTQSTGVTCADKLAKAKLAACLAPDRRVVVDVQGVGK